MNVKAGRDFVGRTFIYMSGRELAMLYAYLVSPDCEERHAERQAQYVLDEFDARDKMMPEMQSGNNDPRQLMFSFMDDQYVGDAGSPRV
jgi:hypothetical protein